MANRGRRNYWKIAGPVLGSLTGLGLTALLLFNKDPDYGLALFFLMPMSVGIVTSSIVAWSGVSSFMSLLGYSGLALGLQGAAFFAGGGDGFACLAMSLLVLLVPLVIGCFFGYAIAKSKQDKNNRLHAILALLIILPPVAVDELFHRDHADIVTYSSRVDVAASPDVVWQEVEHLGTLPPATDWLSKLGLACPESTVLKGRGVGAERDCTLSTGLMKETITAWEPSKMLGFVALQTPPTMKELNPFGDPHPAHLEAKYFRILYGEFKLERIGDGLTRLTRTTRYEHRIRPAIYWTQWCNLAADYAHSRVLECIKQSAEARGSIKMAKN